MYGIILAVILSVLVFVNQLYKTRFWQLMFMIPGPKAYPIVGNLFDAITTSPEKHFQKDRERAKKHHPIFKMWSFHTAFVALLTPEDIELLTTNGIHNSKARLYSALHEWLGTGLLTSEGTKWHTRRKILTPAFHFSILQEFLNIFNKETQRLVTVIQKRCQEPFINVLQPITEFTLNSIAETSMGVELDNSSESNDSYKSAIYDMGDIVIKRAARTFLQIPFIYRLTPLFKKEKETIEILHRFSNSVIKERQEKFLKKESYSRRKHLALLDLLLKAKQDGADIDQEGIREEVDTFMFEGHDTTSLALCYSLMALANERKVQDEIYQEIYEILGEDVEKLPTYNDLQEMKYMERCIKEILRLYPSVPTVARVIGEDMQTHTGYLIPKGCDVGILIYDLHRNPQIYPDPEKFDPDRFLPENVAKRHPFAYIPFSAGPRNCIGQKYGMIEIKAALSGILRSFKLEPVDTPQTVKYKADLVLRPASEIRVKFVPRK